MTSATSSIIGALAIVYAGYRTLLYVSYHTALRRYGCVEAPRFAHKEPFLGLDLFMQTMSAFKSGNVLEYKRQLFDTYGKTFSANSLGLNTFYTIDPEVSKAVHSTYSAKFGLQSLRYDVAKHLRGNGIIVVDGAHWQRRRALIRASFDLAHVANLERLRKYTAIFFNRLPEGGQIVDLLPRNAPCFYGECIRAR